MTEVVKLYEDHYYATCPNCGSVNWNIEVNAPGRAWTRIVGTECDDCSYYVAWDVVAVAPDQLDNLTHEKLDEEAVRRNESLKMDDYKGE